MGKSHLLSKPIVRRNEDGRTYNLTSYIINSEMMFFPALVKMDGLDAMSRFYDLNIMPPMVHEEGDIYPEHVGDD
jgi:hypothetical protein